MLATHRNPTPFGVLPGAPVVVNAPSLAHLLLSEHCRSEGEFPIRALEAVCRTFPTIAGRFWLRPDDGARNLIAHTGLEIPSPSAVALKNPRAGHRLAPVGTCRVVPLGEVENPEIGQWGRQCGVSTVILLPLELWGRECGQVELFSVHASDPTALETINRCAPWLALGGAYADCRSRAASLQEFAALLVRSSPAALIGYDAGGRVRLWSPATEKLLGWSSAQACGNANRSIPPDRLPEFQQVYQFVMTGKSIAPFQTTRLRHDGLPAPVQVVAHPQFDDDGNVSGMLECLTDKSAERRISRHVQVEQRLFDILEASQTIEQAGTPFLQTLCETIGWDTGELWLVDGEHKVLTEEARWSHSQPGDWAIHSAPRQLPCGEKLAGRAWQAGAPVFSTEPRAELPTGLAVAALRDLPGFALPVSYRQRILGVLVFRDPLMEQPADELQQALTTIAQALGQFLHLKQTEAALSLSESKLRQSQKMDSVGMLTGGIAHDFNNVLTVILSYSEIASDELAPDHLVREMLTEIHNAGRRAASMTRRLLTFTRQQTVELQPLNLNEMVAEMERMLRRLVGSEITLENSLLPALGTIRADASQIDQLLVNFVVNARDAMPQGGRINISTSHASFSVAEAHNRPHVRAGDFVVLTVRDTGIGMDEATKARIFEPFFTTKGVGRGTGMGLATVAAIVEQSGGFLDVKTAPGEGTAMNVYFPRIHAKLKTLEVDRRIEPTLGGQETVLIVEDDEDLRKLLRRVIQVRGYHVLEAANASEAFSVVANSARPTSLILMNDGLGGTAYQETCRQLQQCQTKLQVVLISDRSDHSEETPAPAGVHVLQKPFTSQDLARKIRSVLDRPQK